MYQMTFYSFPGAIQCWIFGYNFWLYSHHGTSFKLSLPGLLPAFITWDSCLKWFLDALALRLQSALDLLETSSSGDGRQFPIGTLKSTLCSLEAPPQARFKNVLLFPTYFNLLRLRTKTKFPSSILLIL